MVSLSDLAPTDAVELPCQVSRQGVRPAQPGAAPEAVRGLLLHVKRYERLVSEAALTGRRDLALEALELNPLVGSAAAAPVLSAYEAAFGAALGLAPKAGSNPGPAVNGGSSAAMTSVMGLPRWTRVAAMVCTQMPWGAPQASATIRCRKPR